jgi:hypothetical protein
MPTIAIVINWRNQVNKSGLYPLHIRIGINDNYRYYKIGTPTKVKLSEWSGQEDGWLRQSDPF